MLASILHFASGSGSVLIVRSKGMIQTCLILLLTARGPMRSIIYGNTLSHCLWQMVFVRIVGAGSVPVARLSDKEEAGGSIPPQPIRRTVQGTVPSTNGRSLASKAGRVGSIPTGQTPCLTISPA